MSYPLVPLLARGWSAGTDIWEVILGLRPRGLRGVTQVQGVTERITSVCSWGSVPPETLSRAQRTSLSAGRPLQTSAPVGGGVFRGAGTLAPCPCRLECPRMALTARLAEKPRGKWLNLALRDTTTCGGPTGCEWGIRGDQHIVVILKAVLMWHVLGARLQGQPLPCQIPCHPKAACLPFLEKPVQPLCPQAALLQSQAL